MLQQQRDRAADIDAKMATAKMTAEEVAHAAEVAIATREGMKADAAEAADATEVKMAVEAADICRDESRCNRGSRGRDGT